MQFASVCVSILSATPSFSVLSPTLRGRISANGERRKELSETLNSYEVPENQMTNKEDSFALWEY